jgi:hypothetical protein
VFDEDFETDAYKDCATNSLYVEFDAFAKRHAKHTTHYSKQETNHGNNS